MPKQELPRIVRRRSSVHGYGVFAAKPIPTNCRIINYAGELIRNAAVGGNIARFINHSCTPNCWFEVVDKTIWIRAKRNIRRGEELTYDYRIIGERTIPCRCRPGCPNKL